MRSLLGTSRAAFEPLQRSGHARAMRSRSAALASAAPAPLPPEPSQFVNAYWAGPVIVALARNAKGELFKKEVKSEYVSFIRAEDATPQIVGALRQSRHVVGLRTEGKWLRIRWVARDVAMRAAAAEGWFAGKKIKVYEADLDPVRRWATDAKIEIARPRRGYIDIETDSRLPFARKEEARILSWSLVTEDGLGQAVVLEEDTDATERDLLRAFWKALDHVDQVLAWNGDRFDFPMLRARSERVGLAVETRRWLWLDHMVLFQRFNASASESGEEKQSMALGAVAKAVLGEGEDKLVKLGELGGPSTWGMWSAGGEERERLRLYNLDDALKMRAIEAKTGYVELLFTTCQSTHTFPDSRGIQPTQQLEGFLLRLGQSEGRDMHFPTHHFAEGERDQFRGAFVMEPKKRGVLRDVHVGDFARLYPSIILSWNMSPETWRPDVRLRENPMHRPSYLSHLPLKTYPLPEGHNVAAITEHVFVNEPEGILPAALSEMLRLRVYWDKVKARSSPGTPEWQEAARRSAAYKIAANSFFGVVGSPFSRFFERAVGESITQCGVWLIEETIKAAEARRWKVIYGDTDSLFVTGCSREEFLAFTEWCNAELYPRLLREQGCSRNFVKLEYEKAYSVLVLVGKKRYAARYLHFKGKEADEHSKPEIKGLEYKRGDALRFARQFQRELIELLLTGEAMAEQAVELCERWKQRVLFEPLELGDVVQAKRLSKSIREYSLGAKLLKDGKTQAGLPAHVEVAKVLRDRGRDVGAGVRIEYLVTDGSCSPMRCCPAEDWETLDVGPAGTLPTIADAPPGQPALDRHYLWETLVYPPSQRVLEACFPAGPWKQFERTRPPKLRGRAARELGLPGLDMGAKEKSPQKGSQELKTKMLDGVAVMPGAVRAGKPGPRATGQKSLW